jgi:hypothetical protein
MRIILTNLNLGGDQKKNMQHRGTTTHNNKGRQARPQEKERGIKRMQSVRIDRNSEDMSRF